MTLRELIIKLGFEVEDEKIKKTEKGINDIVSTIKKVAVAWGGINLGKKMIGMADEEERLFLALEGFNGSAERTKKILEDLDKLVKKEGGVFPEENFKNAAQQLSGVNMAAEDIVPTLKQIGDVAAIVGKGNANVLNSITDMYAMIQSRGEVSGRQLKQFTAQNIPIVRALAQQFGVTESQIYKMNISAKDFNAAFKKMSEIDFAQGMIRSSKTWSGLLSIIFNIISKIAETIGTNLLPIGKEFATVVKDWLGKNQESIINTITGAFRILARIIAFVIAVFEYFWNTLFAGTTATNMLSETMKTFEDIILSVTQFLYKYRDIIIIIMTAFAAYKITVMAITAAIKVWTVAQGILNAVVNANLIGRIVAGIAALIAIGVLLYRNWDRISTWFKEMWAKWGTLIKIVLGPIGLIIHAAELIYKNWSSVKKFFVDLWNTIATGAEKAWNFIKKIPVIGTLISAATSPIAVSTTATASTSPEIPMFANGINYVPRTGLAVVHQGEQIIPAGGRGGRSTVVNNNINSPVTIQVPIGTTASQADYLRRVCQDVVNSHWQSNLRQAQLSTNAINPEGGI